MKKMTKEEENKYWEEFVKFTNFQSRLMDVLDEIKNTFSDDEYFISEENSIYLNTLSVIETNECLDNVVSNLETILKNSISAEIESRGRVLYYYSILKIKELRRLLAQLKKCRKELD